MLAATNKYHTFTRDTFRDQIDYGNFIFCDSKGTITKKFNCKFEGVLKCFDLRSKDLREASINNMPLKSIVIDTKKYKEKIC